MSTAFHITEMDISNVLESMGLISDLDTSENLLSKLDHAKCEKAALYGDDIDQQTNYAFTEIERQLVDGNLLPALTTATPIN